MTSEQVVGCPEPKGIPGRKRRCVITTASVLVAIAILYYVVLHLDRVALCRTFSGLQWGWLFAALSVYALNYVLRAIRFSLLLSSSVPIMKIVPVVNLHGMLNYLLPAKSGELAFPVLLERVARVPLVESTATLLVVRFLDFAALSVFLPIVLAFIWRSLPPLVLYASLVFCGLIYLLGAASVWLLRRPTLGSSFLDRLQAARRPLFHRILRILYEFVDELRRVGIRCGYTRPWLLTLAVWVCTFTKLYFILFSIGHQLSYLHVMIISLVTIPVSLLPLRGFANLGTHEASWVASLMLLGQTRETALAVAVGSHIVLLGFVLILGLVGVILLIGLRMSHRLTAVAETGQSVDYEYKSMHASGNRLYCILMRRYYRTLDGLLSGIQDRDSVIIDLGCGEGFVLRRVLERNPFLRLVALDLNPKHVWLSKQLSPPVLASVADVYAIPFAKGAFDIVLANEIMEHLEEPSRGLREIRRIAKRHVVFSVPYEPLFTIGNLIRGAYWSNWGKTPAHCNFWSKRSFVDLVSRYFAVIRVTVCLPWVFVLCERLPSER